MAQGSGDTCGGGNPTGGGQSPMPTQDARQEVWSDGEENRIKMLDSLLAAEADYWAALHRAARARGGVGSARAERGVRETRLVRPAGAT